MKTVIHILLLHAILVNGIPAKEFSIGGMFNSNFYSRESNFSEIQFRYFPRVSVGYQLGAEAAIDLYLEPMLTSRIVFEGGELNPFRKTRLKNYRAWFRYSKAQWELRIGLQKINFGPARLLRSLQWFDQIDPRDPLAISRGVYGFLMRYYQLNNWNYWFWAVWQKDAGFNPVVQQQKNRVEWGGRIEAPLLRGTWGVTADSRPVFRNNRRTNLNRVALDARYDWYLGYWAEFVAHQWKSGSAYYQGQWTLGLDYTLPIGNGIYLSLEAMGISNAANRLMLHSGQTFGAFQFTYPLSLFNSASLISFWDWKSRQNYYTITLTHQRQNIELHIQAFLDKWNNGFPGIANGQINFGGNALLFILVVYH